MHSKSKSLYISKKGEMIKYMSAVFEHITAFPKAALIFVYETEAQNKIMDYE